MHHEGLPQGDDTLLRPRNAPLEHEEVVLHDTVMGEATERSNRLLRCIGFRRGVVLVVALADTVDLLVEFRSVVVTVYAN